MLRSRAHWAEFDLTPIRACERRWVMVLITARITRTHQRSMRTVVPSCLSSNHDHVRRIYTRPNSLDSRLPTRHVKTPGRFTTDMASPQNHFNKTLHRRISHSAGGCEQRVSVPPGSGRSQRSHLSAPLSLIASMRRNLSPGTRRAAQGVTRVPGEKHPTKQWVCLAQPLEILGSHQ